MNCDGSVLVQTMNRLYSLETANLFVVNSRKFNLVLANYIFWFFQTLTLFQTNLLRRVLVLDRFEVGASGATSFRILVADVGIPSQGNVMNDQAASVGAMIVLADHFYRRTSLAFISILSGHLSFVVWMNVETFVFNLSCLRYFFAKKNFSKRIRFPPPQHRKLLDGVALRLIWLQQTHFAPRSFLDVLLWSIGDLLCKIRFPFFLTFW